jgi:hypothetical protein
MPSNDTRVPLLALPSSVGTYLTTESNKIKRGIEGFTGRLNPRNLRLVEFGKSDCQV